MNSYKEKFDWIEQIKKIVKNSDNQMITFEKLRKEIIREYRQVKPDSNKSTKELLVQLDRKLSQTPFITRLGDDIYYLYYIKNSFYDC